MNFQKVKINGFNKAVLIKTCLGLAFEFIDVLIQPNRISQIEFMADLLQPGEHFTGPVQLCAAVIYNGILYQMIIFKNFSP